MQQMKEKEINNTKDLVFVNYVLDNVHGFIGLTFMEDKIERLPIFKRLQDISQLGLVKRIFPGALHNRYIHSLGVMHVIDQMALHLGHFSIAERQLLRLAGMLHDLGHYPLSHDLEQVYDKDDTSQYMQAELMEDVFLKDIEKELKSIQKEAEKEKTEEEVEKKAEENDEKEKDKEIVTNLPRELVAKGLYHHESVTALVIHSSKAIKDIIIEGIKLGYFDEEMRKPSQKNDEEINKFSESIIEDICALIQGNSDYQCEKGGAFPEHFTAMIQMLHSELDADRIDYLLRDATFSGASYGEFDVGLLLQNLAMKEVTKGKIKFWVVGIKEKGIGCADQYMVNRYLAYTQVIFNKYTSAIGKMVREVVDWMMDESSGMNFYSRKQVLQYIHDHEKNKMYLGFTDSYFFEKLNSIRPDYHSCPPDINYFVEKLKEYCSLDVETEDVFSGDILNQYKHIKDTDLYQLIEKKLKGDSIENDNHALYLLSRKKITNHVPYESFKKEFDKINGQHEQPLPFVNYEKDRLMDGLAVIKDDGEVLLLIDSPRSIMSEMYKIQQVMLREYKFPDFNQ